MKNKLTAKDIRKAAKILEKHELKPDGDGLITIEIENPRESTDFFAKRKQKRDRKMMKKIKMKYVGFKI